MPVRTLNVELLCFETGNHMTCTVRDKPLPYGSVLVGQNVDFSYFLQVKCLYASMPVSFCC